MVPVRGSKQGGEIETEKGSEGGGQEPPTSLPPVARELPHSPQDRQAPGPDVLAAMLDARYEVGHELLNGAFVLDGARDALRDLHLVSLAVWRAGRLSPTAQGSGDPTPPLEGTGRGATSQQARSVLQLCPTVRPHGL